ncbi:MAG TPA: helix-turn-helix domain-containing protein [Streptosporangiaceae bacterium]|nr:helix-turn-helix domain-containing protein [Streptosporangiaceae bacterium]
MTVGQRLAQARRDSGLSVADICSRTQIRPNVVDGIEHDDFSECGGDFAARAEIRAIAEAIGLPAEPFVDEFEATELVSDPMAAPHAADRRMAAAWGADPVPVDEITEPIPTVVTTESGADVKSAPGGEPTGMISTTATRRPRVRSNVIMLLGVALLALAVLGGYLLAFGAGGSSPRHASAPAGGSSVNTSGHHRHSASPTAGNSRRAHALRPVRISAFGPGGVRHGDHPQLAHLALGGHSNRPWHSSWYASAHFGNLQAGTGLVLDMGRKVSVKVVRVALGNAPGANLELRVGNALTLSRLHVVARATGAGRSIRLHLKPRRGRYVLLWFTKLPPDHAGTFRVSVYKIMVLGHR